MKTKQWIIGISWVTAALLLSACASNQQYGNSDVDRMRAQLDEKERLLSQQNDQIQTKEQKISSLQGTIEQQQTQLDRMRAGEQGMNLASSGGELLPPGAKSGQCFARIWAPPTYSTVSETVLKSEASERVEVIPAQYETVTERVMVKEASQRLETIPAQYGFKEEQVLVRPETKRLVEVPAQFKTVQEKIMVKPAHTVWKKGTGPIQRIDESTGEIMCLVEVPAQYKTVSKRVMVAPASTKEMTEPPQFTTVKRRVMTQEPQTRVVEIPAEYKTVKVTRLVKPAEERRIPIPAEYQTVTKRKLEKEGQMEWREILCETNMDRNRITQIQRALQANGHNPGPIDGVVGRQTMQAVNSFQKEKGLLVSKYLTIDTIRALGMNP